MEDAGGSPGGSDTSPREALERAKDALKRLEAGQASEHRLTAGTRFTVAAVIVLAWGGLIVHTFLEEDAPKVDSTSVALLAVALVAPFVSRLKALEVGGAKAEWREGAEVGLKELVQLVGMQQAALEQLFDEVVRTATASDTDDAPPRAGSTLRPADVPPQPLRRLLWVDDHPEYNTYEMDSLHGILDVVTAKTNDEAFAVLESQAIDAVISDVGRDMDRPGDPPGGVQLLHELRQRYPTRNLPVAYYTSDRAIKQYGQELVDLGAAGMTSLFSELLRILRQVDQENWEFLASAVAQKYGAIRTPRDLDSPDVVVELPDGTVGIEVASWLQRPQMSAFTDRARRLCAGMERGDLTRGLLLVRPEVLDDRRRAWAEERRIELVAPDQLSEALADHP